MLQPDEIPQFRGDETPQEAERWLKNVIIATGSFSDSGTLRFIGSQIEDNSPAMRWYEDDEISKTSWTRFQRQFRDRWVQGYPEDHRNRLNGVMTKSIAYECDTPGDNGHIVISSLVLDTEHIDHHICHRNS
ncbi:hypothetical protein FRC02_012401 [Tulasnella sp. 418]|nr:hypothetical protein FRC02_012401 [Tulasnella sp. 418]